MTIRSRYTAAITDKPWWLAGGIPASACVAAYQPVGASSYEASWVNLANPGNVNIDGVDGGDNPTWNSTSGWYFNGSSSRLKASGYTVIDTDLSILVRINGVFDATTVSTLISTRRLATGNWSLRFEQYNNTGKVGATSWGTGGMGDLASSIDTPTGDSFICLTKRGTNLQFYVNNSTEIKTGVTLFASDTGLQFGYDIRGATSAYSGHFTGYMMSVALYHAQLTSYQVGALTNAMNAL